MPELSVKGRISGDVNTSKRSIRGSTPSTTVGAAFNGIGQINTGTVTHYMGEATLNYNKRAQ